MKWNYLTKKEAEMNADLVDLQIVLGFQTCKTKQDVINLLKDVRQHEKLRWCKLLLCHSDVLVELLKNSKFRTAKEILKDKRRSNMEKKEEGTFLKCDRCGKEFEAGELVKTEDKIGIPMLVCYECEKELQTELDEELAEQEQDDKHRQEMEAKGLYNGERDV